MCIGRGSPSRACGRSDVGRLHIVVKGGNHGREPWLKRTPAKQRARRNYDWFIGLVVRKMLAGDQRITWHIDEAPQSIVPV